MQTLLPILLMGSLCVAHQTALAQATQTPPCSNETAATVVPGPNMSEYAATRENALAPAFAADRCHDYPTSYSLFLKALEIYPNDVRVLMFTAEAAVHADQLEESIPLYQRALAQGGNYSLGLRAGLMQVFIKLNRWRDVEVLRLDTRRASLAGDKTLPPENGYPIDVLNTGKEFIRVIEYPTLSGRYHTRDRFLFYEEKDPCTGFTPYIDLESDAIDQIQFAKQHPDKAAAGDRSFSLDIYPSPGSQGLIKFYSDGEPTYQTLRSDVLAAVAQRNPIRHEGPCTTPPSPASQSDSNRTSLPGHS